MRKTLIGIMGPGEAATDWEIENARELGRLIARAGWILLTGGRNVGVMHAANLGAKEENGLTLGILPSADEIDTSAAVDIAIYTGMGSARNNINVLSSAVVIVCGMSSGTASEAALALRAGKPVILLTDNQSARNFFPSLATELLHVVDSALQAIELTKHLIAGVGVRPGS
jgi:uncharacterized protein (TIGR00725 family)